LAKITKIEVNLKQSKVKLYWQHAVTGAQHLTNDIGMND